MDDVFSEINKKGNLWVASTGVLSIGSGQSFISGISTGDNDVTIESLIVETDSPLSVLTGYENGQFSGGSVSKFFNRNRNVSPTALPWADFYSSVNVDTLGELFAVSPFIGTRTVGASRITEIPLTLTKNNSYIFDIENQGAQLASYQVIIVLNSALAKSGP